MELAANRLDAAGASRGSTAPPSGLNPRPDGADEARRVAIDSDGLRLEGELVVPAGAVGVAIFAHGSGSSRHSPRGKRVASILHAAKFATLRFDLLSGEEEAEDALDAHLRFNIPFLAARVTRATQWLRARPGIGRLALGYVGAGTGAAAALVAAADAGNAIRAIVAHGGRPDLAKGALSRVLAPTLMIVGAYDEAALRMNRRAGVQMQCERDIRIIPGATHLFTEPGAIDLVAEETRAWFIRHLMPVVA